jgi:hypothetical protein
MSFPNNEQDRRLFGDDETWEIFTIDQAVFVAHRLSVMMSNQRVLGRIEVHILVVYTSIIYQI